jgi:hypothetical protein
VLLVEHSEIREVISRYRGRDDMTVAEASERFEIVIRRDDVQLTVTVPKGVFEWFVAAKGPDGAKVSDWCDYEGYDGSPASGLDRDMARDIDAFLSNALRRELRFVSLPALVGEKRRLEWLVDGAWRVAVPLAPDDAD